MSPRPPTAPGSLMTRREIQAMLGVSRARVFQITEHPGFPRPVDDGVNHDHPIWRRAAVEKWRESRGG